MVGGKVLEVAPMGNKLRIWVVDTTYSDDELAIYVEDQRDVPAPGDSVWWHGRKAFWTTKNRSYVDRPMNRIGYSFDPRKVF